MSSSAAGGIHGLLLKLHKSLSDEDTRAAALKCHDIVGDLGHECMLTPAENELDPGTSKEIFQYAMKAINPQMEMTRYAVTFGKA